MLWCCRVELYPSYKYWLLYVTSLRLAIPARRETKNVVVLIALLFLFVQQAENRSNQRIVVVCCGSEQKRPKVPHYTTT